MKKDFYCTYKDKLLDNREFVNCHDCGYGGCMTAVRKFSNTTMQELVQSYKHRMRIKKLKRINDFK